MLLCIFLLSVVQLEFEFFEFKFNLNWFDSKFKENLFLLPFFFSAQPAQLSFFSFSFYCQPTLPFFFPWPKDQPVAARFPFSSGPARPMPLPSLAATARRDPHAYPRPHARPGLGSGFFAEDQDGHMIIKLEDDLNRCFIHDVNDGYFMCLFMV